jgi:Rad3-related DNA helicase
MLEDTEPSDFVLSNKTRINLILKHQDVAWARTYRSSPNEGVTVFIPSPDVTLRELAKRSGKLLFMSATIHKPDSLMGIFNINSPKIVEAEIRFPGTLKIMEPIDGNLPRVTFRNWRDREFREGYWMYLDELIDAATRPCLVQVHAFKYLPEKYQPSDEQRQKEYWNFGDDGVMFSTRTDRGVDLKDDLCRSIIIMKYPLPNTEDVVFKTMKRLLGEDKFWAYLRDIADRNLVQQCGRAVRNQEDWCEIYTPDGEVLRRLPRLWRGRYTMTNI